MKIYTKTGDKGTTSLVGGTRVEKDDIRLEAYGSVDELNAAIALIITSNDISEQDKENLVLIQHRLFDIGARLATESNSPFLEKIPQINNKDIDKLESFIDQIQAQLEPLNCFILPGGTQSAAFAHLARTICRRAERNIFSLSKKDKKSDFSLILAFINRLSDYLFVLARKLSSENENCEIKWEQKA